MALISIVVLSTIPANVWLKYGIICTFWPKGRKVVKIVKVPREETFKGSDALKGVGTPTETSELTQINLSIC
jgi:hypothetical protein